jgi:DNA repair exonuclease SbcCD ATPase subunit
MREALSIIIQEMQKEYTIKKSRFDSLKEQEEELTAKERAVAEYNEMLEKVLYLLSKTSEFKRRQACKKFEEIGTMALQNIMSPDFRLEIEIKEDTASPEVEIYVISEDNGILVKNTPEDDRGGGIVDIVSVSLRIGYLEITNTDGPIILDEPGKHIDESHIDLMSNFLNNISVRLDRQIIYNTHSNYMARNSKKTIRVHKVDGISQIENIGGVLNNGEVSE